MMIRCQQPVRGDTQHGPQGRADKAGVLGHADTQHGHQHDADRDGSGRSWSPCWRRRLAIALPESWLTMVIGFTAARVDERRNCRRTATRKAAIPPASKAIRTAPPDRAGGCLYVPRPPGHAGRTCCQLGGGIIHGCLSSVALLSPFLAVARSLLSWWSRTVKVPAIGKSVAGPAPVCTCRSIFSMGRTSGPRFEHELQESLRDQRQVAVNFGMNHIPVRQDRKARQPVTAPGRPHRALANT